MRWVLFYELVDDYLERRPALREEHLALARAAHERGELLQAGALSDPFDRALLVFAGDDGAARAEAFKPRPIPTCRTDSSRRTPRGPVERVGGHLRRARGFARWASRFAVTSDKPGVARDSGGELGR